MKKITTMAYVAALALVSTAGLTSCKSDEPVGNYSGETVKTQFAITLPKEVTQDGPNRMKSTTVQKNGLSDFQGITGITLIPFAKQGLITGSDARLGDSIPLTENVSSADLSGKASSAKVYSDVSIPLTTASFLFYGKSAKTGTQFETGAIVAHMENSKANPSSYTFDLKQICSGYQGTYMTSSGGSGYKLMAYLTSIAVANDGATPTAKPWYAYTDVVAMDSMFHTFTSMKGLSSFEVQRVLTDLYVSLKPLTSDIATGIKTAIRNSTYIDTNELDNNDKVVLVSEISNFPGEANLPEGSISLTWDATNHIFKEGLYTNMATPSTYVYPAQLWYYANSQIVTSNTSKKSLYESTTDSWTDILNEHTDAIAVNTRTRAVAVVNPIQYAVGRLDVAVRLSSNSLVDNSESAVGVATNVAATTGFPVTAVFVGGQKQVGFDFTPKGSSEYTIYDKDIADVSMKAAASGESYSPFNYTLVFENGNEDVMLAVELVNNTGEDFYGVDNQLIPKNGKFYVVAQLKVASPDDPEHAPVAGHVFKQDYITTAKLTLKNLKHAYNTLPDLRTPQLELGFSVDLTWQNGNTYTVDFE